MGWYVPPAGVDVITEPRDWHRRYLQQAGWTYDLRQFLYKRISLTKASVILDIGCGTGALMPEFHNLRPRTVLGLDISFPNLQFATHTLSQGIFIQGNAYNLPFPSGSVDACFCHFLLLWLAEPLMALQEMHRVLRPGGSVLVMAEPDYAARIDYPSALQVLGNAQTASLKIQGANPEIGRSVAELLATAGFLDIETGVLGGQWKKPSDNNSLQIEWEVLRSDLTNISLPFPTNELEKLRRLDDESTRQGYRILYVPTFYGLGIKR